MIPPVEILPRLEQRGRHVLQALRGLVETESPSGDVMSLGRCAAVLADLAQEFLGAPADRRELGGIPCLYWEASAKPVIAVIGHFDTVHPLGALKKNPFRVEHGWVCGPGVLDMKAGIVQALAALSITGLEGISMLITGDEELGSVASRPLIEELARSADVVLVLEPAFDGALKTARKGSVIFDVDVIGKEAHAGLEPQEGVNATIVMAHAILATAALADARQETTVIPTTARAEGSWNTIPGRAQFHIDARAWTQTELERVESAILGVEPAVPGSELQVTVASRRPPMEADQGRALFELAQEAARRAGLDEVRGVAVGGGSDGCFTAAVGTSTLDGLGAVGFGAHTSVERVRLTELLPRAALVAALIQEIRDRY